MKMIAFEPRHLRAIADRDGGAEEYRRLGEYLMATHPWIAYSAVRGGSLVGACGFIFGPLAGANLYVAAGEAYAWAVLAPEIASCGARFHRHMKMYCRAVARTLGLKRVWAEALAASERNCRWLVALGFKPLGASHDLVTAQGERIARFVWQEEN
jgi:hypothetical protein